MKNYTVDKEGRITIPKALRKELGINYDTPLNLNIENDTIIIKLKQDHCKICGENNQELLNDVLNNKICNKCLRHISLNYHP